MFDLQVAAYQADITRVITFMLGRELNGTVYPNSGVPDGHHNLTHHRNDPVKVAKVEKINAYHVEVVQRVLPREAARDAGRRRLAARSHAARSTAAASATATSTITRTCRWC